MEMKIYGTNTKDNNLPYIMLGTIIILIVSIISIAHNKKKRK